jgi:hypothetical protein
VRLPILGAGVSGDERPGGGEDECSGEGDDGVLLHAGSSFI